MVKVKARMMSFYELQNYSFNHPMVKVKANHDPLTEKAYNCFNHPMVKVKVTMQTQNLTLFAVSTTLW